MSHFHLCSTAVGKRSRSACVSRFTIGTRTTTKCSSITKENFFSRAGIQPGMLTLHPQGIHHGPQPQAVNASQGEDIDR